MSASSREATAWGGGLPNPTAKRGEAPRTLRTFWISEGSPVTNGLYRGLGVKTSRRCGGAVDKPVQRVDEALLARLRAAIGDQAPYCDVDEHVASVLRLLAHTPGRECDFRLFEVDAATKGEVLAVPR